jgi:predicted DNA-binding antitoxin AbrB/MazE fold protein
MAQLERAAMSHIVDAIYENGVLKFDHPLPFKDQEKVRVTIESLAPGRHSFMDIKPVSVGKVLAPWSVDDDLLGEMLEGR